MPGGHSGGLLLSAHCLQLGHVAKRRGLLSTGPFHRFSRIAVHRMRRFSFGSGCSWRENRHSCATTALTLIVEQQHCNTSHPAILLHAILYSLRDTHSLFSSLVERLRVVLYTQSSSDEFIASNGFGGFRNDNVERGLDERAQHEPDEREQLSGDCHPLRMQPRRLRPMCNRHRLASLLLAEICPLSL